MIQDDNQHSIDSQASKGISHWPLLMATAATLALWYVPYSNYILYPLRLFVTFLHESGHALAGAATWERFDARAEDWVRTDPPARHATVLFDSTSYHHLPVLNGLARQPHLRPDGSLRYLSTKSVPLFDDAGNVDYILCFAEDVSTRKKTETALFDEKERLRVTLNSIGDAVICTDTAGTVTYLNPVAEKMTGVTVGDAIGQPLAKRYAVGAG